MTFTLDRGLGAPAGTLVAALLLVAVSGANAQGVRSASGLHAWVGCWSAEQTSITPSTVIGPIVCISPTADANVAEVATILEGKVVARDTLDANGRDRVISAKGCTGTQRASWSGDARRVYLRSAGQCEGVSRATTGILALTPSGEWLDIQGVTAGGGNSVRVARYRDVGIPRAVPADISSRLAGRELVTQSARIAAGAPVRVSDVIEASRAVDSMVTEAWVLERAQRFDLSGRDLVKLADAGVSARVTDALVAVSNPRQFALAREGDDGRIRGRGPDLIGGRGVPDYPDPYDTPWGWGQYTPYGYGRGYGRGYGYPGYYYPPAVIVTERGDRSHGRMVKGEGYSEGSRPATTSSESSGARTSQQPAATPSTKPNAAPARTAKPRD